MARSHASWPNERKEFHLSLRLERPQPARVTIRKAMRVGHGQLCLAYAAESLHGGDDADFPQAEAFVEAAEFVSAAEEVRILPAEVPRCGLGPPRPLEPLPQGHAQRGHALADFLLAQGLRAIGKPWAHIRVVRPPQEFLPLSGNALLIAAFHRDEVNLRNAVAADELMDLASHILLKLPLARPWRGPLAK